MESKSFNESNIKIFFNKNNKLNQHKNNLCKNNKGINYFKKIKINKNSNKETMINNNNKDNTNKDNTNKDNNPSKDNNKDSSNKDSSNKDSKKLTNSNHNIQNNNNLVNWIKKNKTNQHIKDINLGYQNKEQLFINNNPIKKKISSDGIDVIINNTRKKIPRCKYVIIEDYFKDINLSKISKTKFKYTFMLYNLYYGLSEDKALLMEELHKEKVISLFVIISKFVYEDISNTKNKTDTEILNIKKLNLERKINLKKLILLQKKIKDRQKIIKSYYRGPGIIDLSKCVNRTDYYFMDEIKYVDEYNLFTFKDEKDNQIYAFKFESFKELYDRRSLNPYTRNEISNDIFNKFNHYSKIKNSWNKVDSIMNKHILNIVKKYLNPNSKQYEQNYQNSYVSNHNIYYQYVSDFNAKVLKSNKKKELKELKNKDSNNKDSKNKDYNNKDSKNKDYDNKDSKNKDSDNKDSKNNNTDNKLDQDNNIKNINKINNINTINNNKLECKNNLSSKSKIKKLININIPENELEKRKREKNNEEKEEENERKKIKKKQTLKQKSKIKVTSVFQKIDMLGYQTEIEWIHGVSNFRLCKFFREFMIYFIDGLGLTYTNQTKIIGDKYSYFDLIQITSSINASINKYRLLDQIMDFLNNLLDNAKKEKLDNEISIGILYSLYIIEPRVAQQNPWIS